MTPAHCRKHRAAIIPDSPNGGAGPRAGEPRQALRAGGKILPQRAEMPRPNSRRAFRPNSRPAKTTSRDRSVSDQIELLPADKCH